MYRMNTFVLYNWWRNYIMYRRNNEHKYAEDKNDSHHNDRQLLNKYIHDIRNSKMLSKDDLININKMAFEDRMEILMVYNEMISHYSSVFEDT